jgi:peptidoglycan/LPS O-acetylase OafA/YrhL
MVFLIGIYFASIHEKIRYRGKRDFFLFFGFIVLIYGEKYLMLKGIAPQLQFFQQLLLFPTLYYGLKISQSPFILTTLMGHPFLARPITLIGAMTLELYLVHGLIRPLLVYYFPHFPENLILFLLLTLILSYGLYRVNTYLIHRIQGKIV